MKFKNILISWFLITTFLSNAFSQDFSREFGVITDHEIKMDKYEKDTTAEAVILYDFGESSFFQAENGFDLNFKRETKIKVLKKSYLDKAEYHIPVYKGSRGKEKIIKFEAYTSNFVNGEIIRTKLSKDQIYTRTINQYWDLAEFAMPNVKVGSVIEYSYEIISPYKFLLKDWEFQSSVPTKFSEYNVKMTPFYEYRLRLQGSNAFDEENVYEEKGFKKEFYNVKYHEKVYQFIMKDVHAFKDEHFISSKDDYIIKLDFQLARYYVIGGGSVNVFSTWENVIKELLKDNEFGVLINRSKSKFKKQGEEVKLSFKNDTERVNYIINHIKQNYSWNGYNTSFSRQTVNEFIKEKTGNSAIINLYLTGALRAAGIEVYPVILSTRKNGKIETKYPFLDPFNYVLAYAKIDEKWQLLDATDTYCPNTMIPEKCFNELALVIKKNELKWLKISHNKMSLILTDLKTKISEDLDTVISEISVLSSAYAAMGLRKKYANDIDKLEGHFINSHMEFYDSIKTKNYEDIEKNYIVSYNASMLTDRIGNKIIIHPFYNIPLNDNPLKEEEREYPIDMIYPKTTMYSNKIIIPENCKIEKLPEDYFFNSDLFTLQYTVTESPGEINLSASYLFKKGVYQAEDYSKIKRYFRLIIKHLNQNIVLLKN